MYIFIALASLSINISSSNRKLSQISRLKIKLDKLNNEYYKKENNIPNYIVYDLKGIIGDMLKQQLKKDTTLEIRPNIASNYRFYYKRRDFIVTLVEDNDNKLKKMLLNQK